MLGSKTILAWKRYGIVILGIPIAKIDLEKVEETREKIVAQNTSICTSMNIENIFWLFVLMKDGRILSLVIRIDNTKMANMLI